MNKATSLILTKEASREVKRYLQKLKIKMKKLEEGTLSFHYGGRPVRAQKSDLIRVISQSHIEDKIELGIRNIILEAILSSESLASGSGYLTLLRLLCDDKINFSCKNRSEFNDIISVVSNLNGEGLSYNLTSTIIRESSIDSRVSLSSSDMAFRPVINSKPSLSLQGHISEMFLTKRKFISECGVMFIDGVVETLGEIDCLLQSFSKEKKSLVLFARGFSTEVSNTLNHNYKNGKLYVFPFKVAARENVYEGLEKHQNYYDIQNVHLIRTLQCHDFSFENNVFLSDYQAEIEGVESFSRSVHVTLPDRYRNLLGIIEDRLKIGKKVSLEAAHSGVGYMNGDPRKSFSFKSIKQSKKSYQSLKASLDNLGGLVLQI